MKISEKSHEIVRDYQKCIGCKACMAGCPMLDKFCGNPKDLLKELLDLGEFDIKLPYSCMLCGYCAQVCPADVSFCRLFMAFRRDSVRQTGGKLTQEIQHRPIQLHQKFSFSGLFSSDIQELQSETIFFPGCALMAYSPTLVQAAFDYLRVKSPGIGYYNKCCGKPTRFLGDEDRFLAYYADLEREFRQKGVKKIITGCQNCFKTLGENSPEIEVISLYEFIAQHGIPDHKVGLGKKLRLEFTLHDPCPTRNEDHIHTAVREIIAKLGLNVEEMTFNRETTLCCGSGGMVPATQPLIAKAHMKRRANEAHTDYILTYCQECVESMRRGGKKSFHILDLLFDEDFLHIPQENQQTLSRWKNRYKGKNILVNS